MYAVCGGLGVFPQTKIEYCSMILTPGGVMSADLSLGRGGGGKVNSKGGQMPPCAPPSPPPMDPCVWCVLWNTEVVVSPVLFLSCVGEGVSSAFPLCADILDTLCVAVLRACPEELTPHLHTLVTTLMPHARLTSTTSRANQVSTHFAPLKFGQLPLYRIALNF